jgi:hypothetical protein
MGFDMDMDMGGWDRRVVSDGNEPTFPAGTAGEGFGEAE